jgi:hypothetical protein
MRHGLTCGLVLLVSLTACDPGSADLTADASGPGPGDPDADPGPGPGEPDADPGPGPGDPDAAPTGPGVDALVAILQSCTAIGGKYATDSGDTANIDVCGLNGGAFWKSDFDIDCDGKRTEVCNEQTDGAYQSQTSAQDSNGDPLDASQLPYFVIPLKSTRWNYEEFDIDLGQVAAVVYDGKIEYAVFGDQGPNSIIGEGSYRLAQLLGIDPDPSSGGTSGPVYFVVFTGEEARVHTIEDHAEAVEIGQAQLAKLLDANP